MAERELLVRIVGDDRDLQRALKSTERSTAQIDTRMQTFGKNVTRAFGAAGIALGTSAIFAEVQRSISAASDLNEQISKSRQVFRDASKEIEDWARTTAQSIGISQRAALTAAGTFGNLFNTVHIGQAQSAEMSRALVQLAADLASFNNASPEDVLTALRSGLIGEAEPLRRFGVLLSETRVQQLALVESGKSNIKALTNQEKALARYHIILQDTASAQGDFSRTSDGLANQQRILSAQVEDLEASLGQVLIPTVTDLVESLNDAVSAAQALHGELGKLQAIGGIDIPINLPVSIIFKQGRGKDLIGGVKDLGKNINQALNDAFAGGVKPFEDLLDRAREGRGRGFTFFPSTPEREPPKRGKSPTTKAADDAEDAAKKTEDDAKRATAARKRQQSAFAAFTKGIGLKLDTAGLTDSLTDDLAVLRELEAAILRQIQREGRTFKLAQQLVTVRGQIAETTKQIADDAKQKSEDAFESLSDSLSLKVELAQATKSLGDDQAALRALERAIINRIADEGKTTDLLRQLAQVRQQQDEVAKQIAENARDRRQANQFKALGLTAEGDTPTPGSGSLLRRAQSLQDRIKGTTLDTPKTRSELARIVSTLKANFKTAGKDVREAIQGMLDEIANGFKSGTKEVERSSGEITRGGIRSTQKLLKGLGLTPEQARELQRRNLGVSAGSHTSAFGFAVGDKGTGFSASSKGGDFNINGPITVVTNDPNDLMKKLQKKGRRSSGGRRGRHGGANLGLQ